MKMLIWILCLEEWGYEFDVELWNPHKDTLLWYQDVCSL
jgi:hypothetical protein